MVTSKRMSTDEKKKVVLEIYHSSKAVYTEKEILTLAAKAGVNANTVAEINTALVDDGLVDKAKIGGSNYFWSFPAKKDRLMQVEHQERLKRIDMLQKQLQEVTGKLADAKRGREDCDGDRASKLQRLADIAKEKGKLQVEYEQLKENDPQAMADLHQELQFCMQAANRWTDNIFQCKAFLVKKRGMDKKQAEKLLGITGDFDYPEDKISK